MRTSPRTKTILAASLGAILGAGAVTALPAPETAPVVVEQPAVGTISGTIRWASPSTWTTVHDAGHEPVGIESIQVLRDRLRVHYTFDAAKVGSVQVTPDEQFTAANVRCGASVGLSYADVFCYMPGSSTPVDPGRLTRKGGNIWVSGLFDL